MAKRKKRKQSPKLIFSCLLLLAVLALAYFKPGFLDSVLNLLDPSYTVQQDYTPQPDRSQEAEGKLQAHFINVGQGDSTLFVTPDGKTILVDAGPNSDKEALLSHLQTWEIERIDLLIFTHPHEDHIGGGDEVVKELDIGRVLMPDCPSSTSTFERLLLAMEEKNLEAEIVSPGDTYTVSDCTVTILGPMEPDEEDANHSSIILKLVYGETSFLISGDAETKSETLTLAQYRSELDADVYQVGHHGSSTSSSQEFLDAISPAHAVISCGVDNEYGHPHTETLERLTACGAKIYRTDLQGSILLLSDGKTVT